MSYPAFTAFFEDPERTMARLCVYMALQPPFLSHAVPKDAKVEVVRAAARVSMGATSKALRWLELRGYVVVHARDARGTPAMTLAYALPAEQCRLPSVNGLPHDGTAHPHTPSSDANQTSTRPRSGPASEAAPAGVSAQAGLHDQVG